MDNQLQNIEQTIRDKFENFAPTPPTKIWEGVQLGIAAQAKPTFFAAYGKQLAVAASVLLVAAIGLWWFMPNTTGIEGKTEISDISIIEQANENTEQSETIIEPATEKGFTEPAENKKEASVIAGNELQDKKNTVKQDELYTDKTDQTQNTKKDNTGLKEDQDMGLMVILNDGQSEKDLVVDNQTDPESSEINSTSISYLASVGIALENETDVIETNNRSEATEIVFENSEKPKSSNWTSGIYITPEFILNDFDSVQLLPTYSLSYEPTYHFNNHFFMRFGVGMTYARDRGFAKVDYLSNDVVGTYEDVYDITFDSIDGVLIPTYYTKTTDIWDTVRHLQVTEVTNKYLYLQTPVLFGYYKKNTRFNWYFYGGPAINILVSKQIEEPQKELEGIDIIDLENNLPERSPYFMQLWVGAGIEYKVGKQVAIAFEPNYRYYFNNLYKDDSYKSGLSGFSLRFGVVFTMK